MKENYERSQLIFVLFPSVIGLLVCMMIRTILEYVGTDCTYYGSLHFTGNLFLPVLPQNNFIIMLFNFNQRVRCPLIFHYIKSRFITCR